MSSLNRESKRRMTKTPRVLRTDLRTEQLETRCLLAADMVASWQNPVDCNDVNQDSFVSPLDGLIIANNINRFGARQLGPVPAGEPGETNMLVDVNGDGYVTALDVQHVYRALAAQGEGETVGVRLEVTDLEGNPITTADVGDQFQLNGYVQDLRGEEGGGVFGAYVDVTYNASLASVGDSEIVYGTAYTNGKDGDTSTAGEIDEVGAFTSSFTPLGTDETLLFSLVMTADAAGELVLASNAADLKPSHEILLFDLDSAVPDVDVDFGSVTLTIAGDTEPAPTIETILDNNTLELEIESPRQLPINGTDTLGQGLTYTVTVADPELLEADFTTGNRSWSVEVADHGTMIFEFFEGRAPRVTERFITLTEDDFFDGISFHRVIDGFVIQGGDPLGNGTGGSDLGQFDDQFHVDLQHNQQGVLSMAKSSDDTNNSQFFVTDDPTPWLDFNHSIFGQLVEGFDVLDSISGVAVGSRDAPVEDVIISNATVFEDNTNAILQLKALASSGTTDVTITATDGNGQSVSETITVNLAESSANTPPFLADIPELTAMPGTTFSFQLESTDIEGDTPIYGVNVITPGNATATVSDTGLVEVQIPDTTGLSSVGLRVSVREPGTATDEQAVTIAVEENIDGTVPADTFDVQEDVADNQLDVLANDNLGTDAQIIRITDSGLEGTASISADGRQVVFSPTADFFGNTAFTYLVQTSEGVFEGTAEINVANVLDAPNAADDFFPQDLEADDPNRALYVEDVDGDIPLTDLFLNDLNADGEFQEIMTITNVTDPQFGTVEWNAFQIRYTPGPDFFGTDTFTYTTTGQGTGLTSTGNVTIEIAERNDAPVVVGETVTVQGGQLNVISASEVLANDKAGPDNESDQTLRISAVDYTGDGTVTLSDDGNIEYTPADGFSGTETITYTVEDDGTTEGAAAPATSTGVLTLNVEAAPDPNEAPVAVDDSFDVVADRANQLVNVLANDTTEDGEVLTITQLLVEPTSGMVRISADNRILIYTPNDGFTGTDTLTYEISDGNGGLASAVTQLNVVADEPDPNEVPVAVDDTFSVDAESANQLLNVLENDTTEADETLTISSIVAGPANGTVQISVDNLILIYTPNAGFSGSDSLTYQISDGNGGLDTATAQITVIAEPDPNEAPVGVDDTISVDAEQANQILNVLDNDTTEADETLTISSVVTEPANGTVRISADSLTLIYTPDAGFSGSDTLTYEISDGNGGVDTADVQITVVADEPDPNNAPTAFNDDIEVTVDVADQVLNVLANDTTLPDTGETLTVVAVSTQPQNGTVEIAADGGSLIYTPNAGFEGTDSLSYQVSDGNGGLASADVDISVVAAEPVDPDPVVTAVDDAFTVVVIGQQTFDVLANDSTSDQNATLTIAAVDVTGTSGAVTLNEDSTRILYTPDVNSPGTDTFTYTVADTNGVQATATVTVTVPETQLGDATYSGVLFNDLNGNSVRDQQEGGIGGVSVMLTGVNTNGADVQIETKTAIDGSFAFFDVEPGTYTVEQIQPPFITDGSNTIGLVETANDTSQIVVEEGTQSQGNLYGERGLSVRFAMLDMLSSERRAGMTIVMEGDELAWVANRGGWSNAGDVNITREGDNLNLSSSAFGSATLPMDDPSLVQLIGRTGGYTMIRITGTPDQVLSAAAVDSAFAG